MYDGESILYTFPYSKNINICLGRNGQHRYNNMDHSVETGIEVAKSILDEKYNEKWIWNVNSKQEYIEKA